MALDDIYKEVILDHYKNPRNKRDLPGAELQCHANNPLCGDEITVYAHLDDDAVAEVTFQGAGCSISQSSASMMTEAVTGSSGSSSTRRGSVSGIRAPARKWSSHRRCLTISRRRWSGRAAHSGRDRRFPHSAYNPADFAPNPRREAKGCCPARPGPRSRDRATEHDKRWEGRWPK